MKIGNLLEQLRAERNTTQATDRGRTASAADSQGVEAVNTVALSATVRNLSTREAGEVGEDIDSEKVAAVKAAIEQGTFRVDSSKVADRLIEQAAELLSAKPRS